MSLLVQIYAAPAEMDRGVAAARAAVATEEAEAAQTSPAVTAVQLPGGPQSLLNRRLDPLWKVLSIYMPDTAASRRTLIRTRHQTRDVHHGPPTHSAAQRRSDHLPAVRRGLQSTTKQLLKL